MRRMMIVSALVALVLALVAPAAMGSALSDKEDAGWACGAAAGLPPGHCISPGTAKNLAKTAAKGGTFLIMVYDPVSGDLLSSETATFDEGADDRPCPNDPESPDGTWWSPVPGLYVCHHQSF